MTTPDVQPHIAMPMLSEPEANNNRRVIGCRKNTQHRAVSLRLHGSCWLY